MAVVESEHGRPAPWWKKPWDNRFLFAPLDTLSRQSRQFALVLAMAAVVAWSSVYNGNLMSAWQLPDVKFYLFLAQGRVDLVPQPFTARPLAPLLARGIAGVLHCWPEGGFQVLAFVCLLWTLGVVFFLLLRTGAPRWMLLAVAAVPFWPQLLSDAGLPDPLYAALLSCLLLALAKDRLLVAAALMLPLMLARESTTLVLFCLLVAGWRRLAWLGSALALGCAAMGALAVRRLSAGGLPNPENLSGSAYLAGKLFSNTLRSLGVLPWSNVYPALCPTPAWQMPLHLGAVSAIGVCRWSPDLVVLGWWAALTVFGALPTSLLAAIPALRSSQTADTRPALGHSLRWFMRWAAEGEGDLLLRFSFVYGGISLLLAPALGVSYTRLIGYGWPLSLVALPRLWCRIHSGATRPCGPVLSTGSQGVLLGLHLLLCGLGLHITSWRWLLLAVALQALVIALLWVQLRASSRQPFRPGATPSAC